MVGVLRAHFRAHPGAHFLLMNQMGYLEQYEGRFTFRIRVPKSLRDALPNKIRRVIPMQYREFAERNCAVCGAKLKHLFVRASHGMVNRAILAELVQQICFDELFVERERPAYFELQTVPQHPDLLDALAAKLAESLKISLPSEKPSETLIIAVHPLKEVVELYLREKAEQPNMNLKTEKDRRNALGLLCEYLGDNFDCGKISREVMLDVKSNLLKRYPKNRKKLYPDLSLLEVLKLKSVREYISETTVNRYLEFFSGFFHWSVQADFMLKNPTEGLFGKHDFFDVRELGPPFTIEELTAIFTMLADLPNRPRFMPKLYPMRYWVNLLALYQGMRLNEICQLYLDDIVLAEEIPCIRIRPNKERQQKVKNMSSVRTIPIHSVILRLGFLGYCQSIFMSVGTKDTVLFQCATALDGGYQRKMQQFNAMIHALPQIDKRKSIHSYRHNFDSELLNNGAEEYFILCLDGPTRNGEVFRRYAKPDMKKLRETLELARYNGLDIFLLLRKTPLSDNEISKQAKAFFMI